MSINYFNLSGKVIGLTGGSGYLGRAMALGLAKSGADVFICGRNEQRLNKVISDSKKLSLPGTISCQIVDITSIDNVEQFLSYIYEQNGSLHGWINNAASSVNQLLGNLTQEGISSTINSCLTSVMLITQAVTERMCPKIGGSIVNISSMYGVVSPQPRMYSNCPDYHNPPAYGAAKAGIIQFTKYAACHYAKNNIRVNCISPGPFPDSSVQNNFEFINNIKSRVPLGRIGSASEIVGPAIFLLSDASSFVTGHNLCVDGGWTSW